MTKKKETPFNNPFGQLKIEEKKPGAKPAPPPPRASKKPIALDEESALFLEAVGEVAPVRTVKARVGPPEPPTAAQLAHSQRRGREPGAPGRAGVGAG